MSPSRQEALLDILIRATKPLAGKTLASRLMVSSRTVRTLIHDLRRDGLPIVSSPQGYSLDLNRGLGQVPQEPHTPEKRLASICTTLVASDSPINVHDLAEELFVSDSTIETDLSRARQMLKQYDLRIERDKDTIRLVGSEGSRRRLVRQFLYGSAKELGPSTWSAMVSEFRHIDIAALRSALEKVFRDHGVELTEYALASIVLHTAVAIDRTQRGHPLGEDQTPSELPGLDITVKSSHAEIQRDAVTVGSSHITPDDDLLDSIVVGCARAVQEVCWVEFAPAEMRSLRDLLVVRGISGVLVADSTSPVAPEVARMTEELLNQLAQDFSIGATSPKGPLNMALHVQGLLVRSAAGAPLPPPLGDGFKRSHPLLHDFALRFAASLEERCGIRIDPVELDYLALHLGMQLMPSSRNATSSPSRWSFRATTTSVASWWNRSAAPSRAWAPSSKLRRASTSTSGPFPPTSSFPRFRPRARPQPALSWSIRSHHAAIWTTLREASGPNATRRFDAEFAPRCPRCSTPTSSFVTRRH